MLRKLISGFSVILLSTSCLEGFAEDQLLRSFEQKVRPLLIARCVECHGPGKQEGGLRLDSEDGLRKGGDSGPVIDQSSQEKSLLLRAIHYADLEMPPKGKLPEEEIAILEEWVNAGAYWPAQVKTIASTDGLRPFTEDEKSYWFYQPMQKAQPPAVHFQGAPIQHPIDAFLAEAQTQQGLSFAPPADRATLAKRLYHDLIGLPPTWQELQSFLNDPSPAAYEQLVDHLLQDPRYGERWGRSWLDLVRFAESDGYKQDDFRPTAYRYRDYVIRSFNQDKPYTQFITEQLAGDEIDPQSIEMRDATHYLRLWIYEYNQRDVQGQWTAILNDLTDVTGEVMLGMSYGCARCHDHKFDPLLQKDYYRLQAFFSPLMPRDDLPLASGDSLNKYQSDLRAWEEVTSDLRSRMKELERPIREGTIESTIEKFPPEVRPGLKKGSSDRLPDEKQLAHLAFLQIENDLKGIDFKKRLKDEKLQEWVALNEKLEQHKEARPKPIEMASTATDVGPIAPVTFIPGKKHLGSILPGIPSIVSSEELPLPSLDLPTTGRRLALAKWMADPTNRLTWRVIVNRLWQQHFGQGIVPNASDFGKLTAPPSHPELLDWLALWMVEHQGSLKQLHRLMVTSQAYQQASYPEHSAAAMNIDPDNRLLWRFTPRRLDADQIRDAMLSASGELDPRSFGPSDGEGTLRRSIYRRAMRNSPDLFLRGFDGPDGSVPVAKRDTTTTSLQALTMMNSKWTLDRASKLAGVIQQESDDPSLQINEAFHRVLLRDPDQDEKQRALQFLGQGNLTDFCHVLLNSSEFLYWE